MIVTLWCLWTFQGSSREWLVVHGQHSAHGPADGADDRRRPGGLGVAGALFGDTEREYSAGQKPKLGPSRRGAGIAFWRSAAIMTVLILLVPAVVKYQRVPAAGRDGDNRVG